MVQFATLRTEFGNIGVLVSNSKLIKIILPNKLESISIELTNLQNHEHFMSKVLDQLNQYFIGRRKQFDLDLNLQVSPFYQDVLNEVYKIPYGQTCSYKEIAKKIKNPKSYRAVANANAANPIPIVVPCHRVILSSGDLGQYGGGNWLKKTLILNEQSNRGKTFNLN